MSDLSKRIESLSPEKRALLERMRTKKRMHEAESPAILPRTDDGPAPLSFSQERLWFLDQLEPGNALYHMSAAIQLNGKLDIAILEQCFKQIVERHAVLRTGFAVVDGQPVQVIAPTLAVPLPVHDLSALPPADQTVEAQRLLQQTAATPFDLTEPPLLRLALLRLAPTQHRLLLTIHHSLFDGWSTALFIRELSATYQAAVHGTPPALPPLPVQYADYAVWQRAWLQGAVLDRHLAYWRDQLAGAPPVLDLPSDRPRPAHQSYGGRTLRTTLPRELVTALETVSRELTARNSQPVTLFMTLLAGWATLLGRLSGQAEVVIGAPIANRTYAEIKDLIGCFFNTLALRIDLAGNPRFADLVARVQQVTLGAYAHQALPFEKLVEVLAPPRTLSASPIFQVVFAFQNYPAEQFDLPDLTIEPVPIETQGSRFDLMLFVTQRAGEISVNVEYSTDLFDEATVARLVGSYQTLLSAVSHDPHQPLATLPPLTAAERTQLLHQWNQTAVPPLLPPHLAHHVAAQVARTPDHIAVRAGTEARSYAALQESVTHLAGHLQTHQLGPETLVALLAPRGVPLLTAMLALFDRGAAYLPLDPRHPPARWVQLLAASKVPCVLVAAELAPALRAALPPDARTQILDLDTLLATPPPAVPLAPPRLIDPQQLAYAIYTSGSTGQPKGALLTQRGMLNHLQAKIHDLALGPNDVVAQTAAQSFDISVWQFLAALLVGATVDILPDDVVQDPHTLLAAASSRGITVLEVVPSLLRALLDTLDHADGASDLTSLRWLIPTGEALPPALVQRWLARYPQIPLLNAYGPTECADDVTHHVLHQPLPASATVTPIGRPIHNTAIYLLDAHGEPVPIGVVGELYVGGAGVGRGYLGDPVRTALAFVPDPFGDTPGARLYRTGDLARYHADGTIAYLGRADTQVKLRGYRIELGEIDATLRRHPAVRDAVVLVQGTEPHTQLVGYLVGDGDDGLIDTVRTWLRGELPEYMLPSRLLRLDTLPLTPNGKLDRQALPAVTIDDAHDYVAPRTEIETTLAQIWAAVLQLPQVGVTDNFFDLGGHSLLATQVISRIREQCGVELPVRALFSAPTIEELAKLVEQEAGSASAADVLPLRRRSARPAHLPLSFSQQRLWFLEQWAPGSAAYHIPVAVRLSGPLDRAALHRSINAVVARHESLRTRFESQAGHPVQIIDSVSDVAIQQRDLSNIEDQAAVQALVRDDVQRPFDLERGPLMRILLARLDAEEHILVLTMHHIISDAWSVGVLVQELAALYEADTTGTSITLPELPIQYADFALWQREWLSGAVLEQQLGYWRQQLSILPPRLELPLDHPRPSIQTFRGAAIPLRVAQPIVDQLTALGQRTGTTLFMALLATFNVLLSQYSGETDIAVGTPIANRNRQEVEGLIGFFVNTLVLRSRLDRSLRFGDFLQHVREVTLEAYTHQDLPFERLVEELQVERNLNATPLFQVMFALHNAPQRSIRSGQLRLQALELPRTTAKFDLSLELAPTTDGLSGFVEYNRDLFEPATISRLAQHFETLLTLIVSDPQRVIHTLPAMSEAEAQRVVYEWNATTLTYPEDACLHELFEQQAERTPDALAVLGDGEQLTYAALNAQANQLAHHLRTLGVEPETVVAVALDRSCDLLVALLAVLKAGAAYVPLDPSAPPARWHTILAETAAPVLLTQASFRDRLPQLPIPALCLDTDVDAWTVQPDATPAPVAQPTNLAYVIYTSGSTGQPKGAMNSHRAIVSHCAWAQAAFPLTTADRMLHKTPISFDVSVWELFWPLTTGAALVLARPDGHKDPQYLAQRMADTGVTTVHFVPAMLRAFLTADLAPLHGQLRHLFCSGEALPTALAAEAADRLGCAVHNLYGPSEAAVDVTAWTLTPSDTTTHVPLGHPVANTQVYVLDAALQPVPIGVVGELYLGGVQLGRGYYAQPVRTAAAFVPDPFGGTPGARLYRTGDQGRWRRDGVLEYLGRQDDQVKVRGVRIELGEVAAALAAYPGVQAQAVLALPSDDTTTLVAYVVAPVDTLDVGALRAFLRERLSDAMLPSAIIRLDALPLLPNGKLDRRALPAPTTELMLLERPAFQPPETLDETLLAAIWSELLQHQTIGTQDRFFALGGHSLLATQLVARIRAAFAVELPLQAVFEDRTLGELAARIDQLRQDKTQEVVPPIRPMDSAEPVPLSFAQERLWFLNQMEPANPFFNMSMAVTLLGELDQQALSTGITAIVERHAVLRTGFAVVGGQPVQVIAPTLAVPLPVHDLSALPPADQTVEAQRLLHHIARTPFDLAEPPLLRLALLHLAPTQHRLLLTIHHSLFDGWSTALFIRELSATYQAAVHGTPPALPLLPVQYADYAVWQRAWLQGAVLDRHLAYWRDQLAGAPPVLDLPSDRPRPAHQSYGGRTLRTTLPRELVTALETVSRELTARNSQPVTLFMTLLAGWATLLGRLSGQAEIVIGAPIANRTHAEIKDLIGCFFNTLALRIDLAGNPRFADLVTRVQQVTLGAYAHQALPFEKLVEALAPPRTLSASPIFQVGLAFQNYASERLDLPGLTIEPVPVERTVAWYDLMLYVTLDADGSLDLVAEYSTDLFEAETVARLLEHYQTLLAAVTNDVQQPLAALPLLTAAKRTQLLHQWNQTAVPPLLPPHLAHHVAAQVARTPDRIAVRAGAEAVSYAALAEATTHLAGHLQAHQLGPETLVALLAPRGVPLLTAMLALFDRGAAYLPLDPRHPPARWAQLLAASQVPCVLAAAELAPALRAALPPDARTQILDLDALLATPPPAAPLQPPRLVDPQQLAYAIYTSGSTGQPKGALLTQRGMLNHLQAKIHDLALTPNDVVAQTAAQSFDISVWQFLAALLVGATVDILPDVVVQDPHALLAAVQTRGTTVLEVVPSLLRALLDTLDHADATYDLTSLRWLIPTGEALPPALVQRWLARYPQIPLLNAYGPTECADDVTHHVLQQPLPASATVTPIGRPIHNTAIYLLDAQGEPVPVGAVGELYVGGAGVGRGYLGDPARTALAFVPDPFGDTPGARLYRTGDLARYHADGTIAYLGRADTQVKLRGYRIELGEIDATLRRHPAVRDAVVLVQGTEPHTQLVGYLVGDGDDGLIDTVRTWLRGELPEYMVPSRLLRLDALPLTPNGKLDRQALPAVTIDDAHDYVAPRTATETTLAQIWAAVLQLPQVGVTDNFFDLGGHSLLVPQLMMRLKQALQRDIDMRLIFEAPTVAEFARLLSAEASDGSRALTINLAQEAILDPAIVPAAGAAPSARELRTVFLTGTTGFLGAYLLADILQRSTATAYCLVRATDAEAGLARIRANLENYRLWQPSMAQQIRPVLGDLSQPYLGLDQEHFGRLVQEVDAIYHAGAWVNFIYPYSALKAANVLGTQEVLRLASQGKTKPVHYISTLSVFAATQDAPVREQDPPAQPPLLADGYAQSKWVADQLVLEAGRRGLPVAIYRPGLISGDRRTGATNTTDFLWAAVKSCVQLGMAPRIAREIDLAPVDLVSQAIVERSLSEASYGQAFHLFNPATIAWTALIDRLRQLGYPIEWVTYTAWRTALERQPERIPSALQPFLGMLAEDAGADTPGSSTVAGFENTSLSAVPIDHEILDRYVAYLVECDFLPAAATRDPRRS